MGEGAAARGQLESPCRKWPRAGQRGLRVGHLELTLDARCVLAEVAAVRGRGQDLNTAGPGGKLKNWKYEKLTVCTPDQHVWIPDFQIFTLHCHPRNSADGAERGEGNS